MKVGKKSPRSPSLRKLHSALKGILNEKKGTIAESGSRNISEIAPTADPDDELLHLRKKEPKSRGNQGQSREKNGIVYVMSREQHPIPKLTDDEILARHKQADENMKKVWSNIISKYESTDDQGDIIDLQTGEILEDNGHLRGLAQDGDNDRGISEHKSILQDMIVNKEDSVGSIWLDEGSNEEEEIVEEESSESENEAPDYIKSVT